jgi:hypothetical protein
MSTTGIDSWAVDLANVTLIYPGQGWEVAMAIVGVVLWLLWHVWQVGFEAREYQAEIDKYGDHETIRKAIDEGN